MLNWGFLISDLLFVSVCTNMPQSLHHLCTVEGTLQTCQVLGCPHANRSGRKNERPGTHGANTAMLPSTDGPFFLKLSVLLPEAFAAPQSQPSDVIEWWRSLLTDFFQSRKHWSQSVQKISRQVLTANGDGAGGVTGFQFPFLSESAGFTDVPIIFQRALVIHFLEKARNKASQHKSSFCPFEN